MSSKHEDYEDALEQQYRRLGLRNPVCVACGERNPFCFEQDHIAGRKHHDDLAMLCMNCHRKKTIRQRFHLPIDQEERYDPLSNIGHYLLGLCELLVMFVDTLRRFGQHLIADSRNQGDDNEHV